MKKVIIKAFAVLFTAVLLTGLVKENAVFAEDKVHVVDGAGLLSSEEAAELEAYLDEISERLDFDVAALTTSDLDGKSPMEYADDFYDLMYGPNTDGCVFLRYISSYDRQLWISTSGIGLTCIYDDYIDFIFDAVDCYIDPGDYFDLFKTYGSLVDDTVSRYKETGSPADIWSNSGKTTYYDEKTGDYFTYNSDGSRDYSISYGIGDWISEFLKCCFWPLVVGLCISLGILGSWRKKLNSVEAATNAGGYEEEGSFELSHQADVFLRQSVSKVKIESSSSSSGGHSSSSHHSSGGGSHGGGGRSR